MSCDRVTNPINNEGTFLVDEEVYPDCYGERTADWSASSNTQYLYGENILKQTHPLDQVIIDDEIIFSQSSLSFDPSKYIAEINPTLNGSLSLAGGQSYLLGSGLEIQLATNELVEYILSGDFV
jgi:hypothetical protein